MNRFEKARDLIKKWVGEDSCATPLEFYLGEANLEILEEALEVAGSLVIETNVHEVQNGQEVMLVLKNSCDELSIITATRFKRVNLVGGNYGNSILTSWDRFRKDGRGLYITCPITTEEQADIIGYLPNPKFPEAD